MEIIYISTLVSKRLVELIAKTTGKNPGYAIQKFSRQLISGFLENGLSVIACSVPPIAEPGRHLRHISLINETEDNINYKYVPFVGVPIIKHVIVVLYYFFFVLTWSLGNKRNRVAICDVLSISACIGTLFASKISGINCVGIVTDIPNIYLTNKKTSIIQKFIAAVNMRLASSFTQYVFLTEHMSALINKQHRPYIVMEGLCDGKITLDAINLTKKAYPKTIVYAGGINERNGVETLVKSFVLSGINARLILFGDGEYAKDLSSICKLNTNIEYRGVAPNLEVVKSELSATLLVNPRFSNQKHTMYSFPSKNMEYMTTATPLLATRLPGIPNEYFSYMYLFEDESVEGYAETLKNIMQKSEEELKNFGLAARRFVLENKNNKVQAKRILDMIYER